MLPSNVRTFLFLLITALTLVATACNGGGLTISVNPGGTSPATTTPASSGSASTTPATTTTPSTSTTDAPAAPAPLRDVKSGWRVETVYQSPLVNPGAIASDGAGSLLVVSQGTGEILTLKPDGTFGAYATTSSSGIAGMAYQSAKNRLLIVDRAGGLTAIAGSQVEKLRGFGLFAMTLAVAPDGSFYGGEADRGSEITHYDAHGNKLETVLKGVDGCFQIVLDAAKHTLYYSETYAGRVSALDLTDGSVRALADGVGIPGTYEPIAVGLDDNGVFYYFTANQGLNRQEGDGFVHVMNSISGVGMIVWSEEEQAFLVANAAGSNLIAYPIDGGPARNLTPYVNAWGIVEGMDGTVLIAEDVISKVTDGGLEPFVTDLPAPCYHLARDAAGDIYAGTIDGRLWRILPDGSYELWAQGFTQWFIVSLSYDVKNDALVAVAANHEASRAEVWRLPLADPSAAVKLSDFSGVRVTPHLPAATVDEDGNVYVLDRQRNVMYRIGDGMKQPEEYIQNVLENEAITVPGLAYSRVLNGLVVSTIQTYEYWPLDSRNKQVLAENNGGVDNFAVNEGPSGDLVVMTSGRVLRLVPDG